jgi:DNA polymerase IIIc chi subunit
MSHQHLARKKNQFVPHGLLLDNKQDVETVFVSICTQK